MSPWVVTLDALEPFKCAAPQQQPPVLPYLHEAQRQTYDVQLSVHITPAGHTRRCTVVRSNLNYL